MEKIPTAETLLKKRVYVTQDDREDIHDSLSTVTETMIEFAKLHVEAALKAASEGQIERDLYMMLEYGESMDWKSSILNSYPLENIK